MPRSGAILLAALLLGGPAWGQDQTLADIRQELSVLTVELQALKRELSTTSGPQVTVGGDTLQRIDLIEAELRRLTAQTETLELRLNAVVRDGTNRVGDLEFRLCELETACDIATLGETAPLGGQSAPSGPAPSPAPAQPSTSETEFALGERGDFDRARAQLDAGDYQAAATLFAQFAETYPGGPLTSEAHYFRGQALTRLGQVAPAARAYLASFSGAPNGAVAAEALLGLGASLGALGQQNEACVTLGEVAVRFPASRVVPDAQAELSRLGCR